MIVILIFDEGLARHSLIVGIIFLLEQSHARELLSFSPYLFSDDLKLQSPTAIDASGNDLSHSCVDMSLFTDSSSDNPAKNPPSDPSGSSSQGSYFENCRDLSYNNDLGGQVTPDIGNLQQLEALMLVSCSFSGTVPSEIVKLTRLTFLALNSNQFIGNIPASLGCLFKLSWLDLADNQLSGSLPVSNGSVPGLDQLVNTQHF
ncbi:hypothetical protein KFK09_016244 [Dendrobium nobile]|uniref:Uncharacterized protein n=1 Tax=Dendrobium nobile TaxID=94219 RepID=A0A8T3AYW3_DENNO|nr:hypothetical protein KFK09_016244 [Dendrobium nobile]